jgi:hypothetical protein
VPFTEERIFGGFSRVEKHGTKQALSFLGSVVSNFLDFGKTLRRKATAKSLHHAFPGGVEVLNVASKPSDENKRICSPV